MAQAHEIADLFGFHRRHHIHEDRPGRDGRELVGVADENQGRIRPQRIEQGMQQGQVDHRGLVHDHDIGRESVLRIVAEPRTIRLVTEQPVQGQRLRIGKAREQRVPVGWQRQLRLSTRITFSEQLAQAASHGLHQTLRGLAGRGCETDRQLRFVPTLALTLQHQQHAQHGAGLAGAGSAGQARTTGVQLRREPLRAAVRSRRRVDRGTAHPDRLRRLPRRTRRRATDGSRTPPPFRADGCGACRSAHPHRARKAWSHPSSSLPTSGLRTQRSDAGFIESPACRAGSSASRSGSAVSPLAVGEARPRGERGERLRAARCAHPAQQGAIERSPRILGGFEHVATEDIPAHAASVIASAASAASTAPIRLSSKRCVHAPMPGASPTARTNR